MNDIVVIITLSSRMLKMPDVLLSGDSPTAEKPDTPIPENVCYDPNHSQCDEDYPAQEWVHLPSMQQFVDSTEGEASSELQATRVMNEGKVGETTAPSTDRVVDSIRGETLRDHKSGGVWYRGDAGETAISPIVMSGEVKCSGDAGETAISPIMMSDIVKMNSPATSTPGSTPSPTGR